MTQNLRRFSIALGISALILGLAGIVYAQGRPGGMMAGMMSMMRSCPMMASMQQGPASALQHRQELGLTDDQVVALETLQDETEQVHMRSMERLHDLHQQIAGSGESSHFDEATVRAAFQQMGEVHTEMGVAMTRASHQTRQILTSEQHEALSDLSGGMMGMHGMMQGGMSGMSMENCPMMQGMMHQGAGTPPDSSR